MNTKAVNGTLRTIVHPPNGDESYNQIDIRLRPTLEPQVNEDDVAAVNFNNSNDVPALEISVYCPITKIFVTPPEGSHFVAAEPQDGTFLPESAKPSSYHVSIDPAGMLSIEAKNNKRVSDPLNNRRENPAEALLLTQLRAADGSMRLFEITLLAPPYRLVIVQFNEVAPNITYDGTSDLDFSYNPPLISMPQGGGIVFTLSSLQDGARFADNPVIFYKHSEDPAVLLERMEAPACICNVGADGKTAFMADVYTEVPSPRYCFKIQVTNGVDYYESEDPTIVNVEPVDPPSGQGPHPWGGGGGALERPAER